MTEQTQPKPQSRIKRIATGKPFLITAALLVGVAIGGSTDTDEEAQAGTQTEPAPVETVTAEPSPAPTVTETAEPEPAPTVTEEVEVEVETVPMSCASAIEAGDVLIEHLSDAIDASADGFGAASRMDPNGINAATERIEALTPQIEDAAFDWGFWSASCQED